MGMDDRPAIVWFRRDLRLLDQPAVLAARAAHRRVVPLFVLDPVLLEGPAASPNRSWFLVETLRSLRDDLRSLGSDLVIRAGDPRVVVPEIAREVGASDVYASRDHAPYGRARDRAAAAALDALGIAWHAKAGLLVHEPEAVRTADGRPYRVFSPFRRAWEAVETRTVRPRPGDLTPLPAGLALGDLPPPSTPTADPAEMPIPGEAAARRRLARWVEAGLDGYARTRDRLADPDGTSRLSQDLHFGLLSATEVVARAERPGEGPRTFRSELVWREFYAHLLFHWPAARSEAMQPALRDLPWSDDEDALTAWTAGRTGYPVIDAAMRQLTTTGWMHNRARMLTASFLTKHLLIDWRRGAAVFGRHLLDGDVASNSGGWQWAASTGSDPQPYVRIFNPVLQGRRFDPDGAYVRRWVPELGDVPTAALHAPWELPGRPAPIVDHATARARALAVYGAARRTS